MAVVSSILLPGIAEKSHTQVQWKKWTNDAKMTDEYRPIQVISPKCRKQNEKILLFN